MDSPMNSMRYQNATKQIEHILEKKNHHFLQQVVDFLHKTFPHYSWVGIYILRENLLHLGPWQGDKATEHTQIPVGKGICGAAAETGKTEVIADVTADDRYLSCFISTKSEIVVPIKDKGKILGELDIDSDEKNSFTKQDIIFLEKITDMLAPHISNL